jgi:hypothetical protein
MIKVIMRRVIGAVVVGVVGLMAAPLAGSQTWVGAAPTASAATTCAVTWGSLTKSDPAFRISQIADVRSGRHACYDRLVIDLKGRATGYTVRYVTSVTAPGSGHVVPLRGGAKLMIVVNATTYDLNGTVVYAPANPRELTPVAGYRTFRQVALAGSFEGETTIGLGVRARLPMRAFVLPGPGNGTRLVIDVAHTW